MYDLLASLVATGLLRRTHGSWHRLAGRLLGLPETLLASDGPHRPSASGIGDLATHTNESGAALGPAQPEASVVSRSAGTRAATINIVVGDALPQHPTAAGKLLGAPLRSAPTPKLSRLTSTTIVKPRALEIEYRRIRRA